MIIDKLKCLVIMPLKREMGLREIEKRWILNSNARRGDISYKILTIFSMGVWSHPNNVHNSEIFFFFTI